MFKLLLAISVLEFVEIRQLFSIDNIDKDLITLKITKSTSIIYLQVCYITKNS